MAKLYPPLDDIEDRLFSPSDRLIQRWVKHDPSLQASVVAALERDALACERRASLLSDKVIETDSVAADDVVGDTDAVALSPFLAEMIERRVFTQTKYAGDIEPAPGQIRLIDRTTGPDGADLEWDMNYPLAVLLFGETEDDDIWYGWMVSGEPDYAGYWDVLLEEADEPYDPLAAIVQLWNPVYIYIRSTGSVLGQLSASRLDALATVYGDFLAGERPGATHARPGTLVNRLNSAGVSVLTGTPMGTHNDPRMRYQDVYFAAAGMVKDVAQLVIKAVAIEPDEARESWAERATSFVQDARARLLRNLEDFADSLGRALETVTFVAAQGQDKDRTQDKGLDWKRVAGLFEEAIVLSEDGISMRLLLRRIEGVNIIVRLKLDARLLQEYQLDEASPDAEIHFEPEPGLVLEVEDSSGVIGTWTLSL